MTDRPRPTHIDDPLLQGQLVPINAVAEARLGKRVAPSTIVRWMLHGIVIRGQRLRLAGHRCGHQWMTTPAAFEAFLAAQGDAARAGTSEKPPPPGRDAATADALRKRGIRL